MHKIKQLNNLLRNLLRIINKHTIKSKNIVLTSYRFLTFSVAFLPFVYGCTQWGPENDEVLARVGNDYLYRDDLIA